HPDRRYRPHTPLRHTLPSCPSGVLPHVANPAESYTYHSPPSPSARSPSPQWALPGRGWPPDVPRWGNGRPSPPTTSPAVPAIAPVPAHRVAPPAPAVPSPQSFHCDTRPGYECHQWGGG